MEDFLKNFLFVCLAGGAVVLWLTLVLMLFATTGFFCYREYQQLREELKERKRE